MIALGVVQAGVSRNTTRAKAAECQAARLSASEARNRSYARGDDVGGVVWPEPWCIYNLIDLVDGGRW